MNRILLYTISAILLSANLEAQDGMLDPNYGANGIVKANLGNAKDYPTYLVKGLVSPDGSLYAVLQIDEDVRVLKLKPDGSPDATYGDFGYSVPIEKITLRDAQLQNGKVIVGGSYYANSTYGVVTARINVDGTFDSSFAAVGISTYSVGGDIDLGALAVQYDGGILVAASDVIFDNAVIFRLTADGQLDISFPIYYGPTGSFTGSITVLKDGKILAAGSEGANDLVLVKFNSDGTFDKSFGTDGIQVTPVPLDNFPPQYLALDSNGNILVGNRYGIFRYTPDGNLDPSFDTDGVLPTSFEVQALAVDQNNKIYAGSTLNDDLFLERINADGTLDKTFSGDGIQTFDLGEMESFQSISFTPGANIVLFGNSGSQFNSPIFSNFEIVQIAPNGLPDPSFNASGTLKDAYHANGATVFYASAIQPDEKLIAVGLSWNGTDNDFVVARYLQNGVLDNSFGDHSYTLLDFNSSDDEAAAVVVRGDGTILLTGRSGGELAIAQLNADGTPDHSFNSNGLRTYNIPVKETIGMKILLQTDGKILVLAGLELARFNADGSLDPTFDADGVTASPLDKSYDMAIQQDGKILVTGSKMVNSQLPGLARMEVLTTPLWAERSHLRCQILMIWDMTMPQQ